MMLAKIHRYKSLQTNLIMLLYDWLYTNIPSTGISLALFRGARYNWGEQHLVSTVRTCAAPLVFVGNLETTVILVCVARPYIY